MCWESVLNEKLVGQVQLETEGSTPVSTVEREYFMILEKKVKMPKWLGLTVSWESCVRGQESDTKIS